MTTIPLKPKVRIDDLVEQYNETKDIRIIMELTDFYELLKLHRKYKDKKNYCKAKIIELSPAFAKGYFKMK